MFKINHQCIQICMQIIIEVIIDYYFGNLNKCVLELTLVL